MKKKVQFVGAALRSVRYKSCMAALSFFLCHWLPAIGQIYSPDQIIPKSPEVAQIQSYVDRPVSYYNGTTGISIPLFEVDVHGIKIPVSLSYNSTGFIPSQEATWVGLGWSLSLTSCVTRSIKAMDDFYSGKGYYVGYRDIPETIFYNNNYIEDTYIDWHWLSQQSQLFESDQNGIYNPLIDMQRDVFSYSFWGGGGKFVLNKADDKCVFFENPQGWRMYVRPESYVYMPVDYLDNRGCNGIPYYFELSSPSGDRYIFRERELTRTDVSSNGNGANPHSESVSVSSWFLSDIVTRTGHEIKFNYEREDIMTIPQKSYHRNYCTFTYGAGPSLEELNNYEFFDRYDESWSHIASYRLKNISWDNGKIVFYTSTRSDMADTYTSTGAQKLDRIELQDQNNVPLRRFQLSYDYFGNGQGTNSTAHLYKRLRLDSVFDMDDPNYKYVLTYNTSIGGTNQSAALPPKDTKSVDYWGYYNGQDYHDKPYCLYYNPTSQLFLDGAIKYSNLNTTKLGMLSSVRMPTGGTETFEYELNEFTWYDSIQEPSMSLLHGPTSIYRIHSSSGYPTTDSFSVSGSAELFVTVNTQLCNNCLNNNGCVNQTIFTVRKNGESQFFGSQTSAANQRSFLFQLDTGSYEILTSTLPSGCSCDHEIRISVQRHNSPNFLHVGPVHGAGLRIASIQGGGKTRTFQYQNGKLLISPVLCYKKHISRDSGTTIRDFIVQVSESATPLYTFKGYQVGYDFVKEICGNLTTEYTFHNQVETRYLNSSSPELYFDDSEPFAGTKPDFQNGLLLSTSYQENGYEIRKETSHWTVADSCHSVVGIYFSMNTNIDYRYTYHRYNIQWNLLSHKKTEQIANGIRSSSDTFFSYNANCLPYDQWLVLDNHNYITRTRYTSDFTDSIYVNMASQGLLLPVEQLQLRDNTVVSGTRTDYQFWNDAHARLPKRESVYNTESGAFVEKILYTKYDTYGNPVELYKAGTPVVYIWSYKGMYPIAEIVNCTYSQASSLLGTSLMSLIQTANAPTEQQLNTIHGLNSSPNLQATVLTYKPQIGVTRIMPPTGKTIYFEYDSSGRLKRKSYNPNFQNSNIESYEYNYSGTN